jgi:hypothetical protein
MECAFAYPKYPCFIILFVRLNFIQEKRKLKRREAEITKLFCVILFWKAAKNESAF